MDLFDWLSIIRQLKDKGLTLKEIGKKINMEESMIKMYSSLLKNLVAEVVDFCKQYQINRATKKVAIATFDFTLKWFMDSGLYDLQSFTFINIDKEEIKRNYQLNCLESFIKDKCNWSKQKLQSETTI